MVYPLSQFGIFGAEICTQHKNPDVRISISHIETYVQIEPNNIRDRREKA